MSRRTKAAKRITLPDAVHNSRLVSMLIKRLMERGKYSLSSRIVYKAMDIMSERTGNPPMEIFDRAIRNATPLVEVKARRVGGATYQVPMEVRSDRGVALALRWLVQYSRSRPGRGMASKLANELIDASNETGGTVRKREETHKMAEANKAFAHYRY
jgi:small subunit ribosomal protein S7